MILGKMNTRATKRTTRTSVFGSSFGGAPTAGASTFGSFTNSGLNADTTPRGGVFDSYSTLFGGRAKQGWYLNIGGPNMKPIGANWDQ